jgi:hypothetical protein
MEALVEKLLARRGRIRELITEFGKTGREPFPKWVEMRKKGEEGWKEERWGNNIVGRVN